MYFRVLQFVLVKTMPGDKKYGPSKPKKRKFCGNKHTKKQTNQNSESIASSDETVSAESSSFGTTTSESADCTTRSEQKLENPALYKLIFDCSSEESGNEEEDKSDSEWEESEETDDANLTVESPAGNRIVDIKILGDNISANLVCIAFAFMLCNCIK